MRVLICGPGRIVGEVLRRLGQNWEVTAVDLNQILMARGSLSYSSISASGAGTRAEISSNDSKDTSVQEEQVSLVLGDGWVLSFQEREGDVFD
jgi:hypothetical protein